MTAAVLYLSTALIFLVIDLIGINMLIQPVALAESGEIFLDGFRGAPAILFYLLYIAGLFWFVSAPALRNGAPARATFLNGAFLGLIAYGAYELTNMATLAAWSWRMVMIDMSWGAFLTGFSAAAGVAITRRTKI